MIFRMPSFSLLEELGSIDTCSQRALSMVTAAANLIRPTALYYYVPRWIPQPL